MSDKPTVNGLEEFRQALREVEGDRSQEGVEPETITIQCGRITLTNATKSCKLVPYERADGRVGWMGTNCDRKCKFPG